MNPENLTQAVAIDRVLVSSPSQIFDAFINPLILLKWWGPQGFVVIHCEVDPQVGGKWRIGMQSPSGSEHWVRGIYREIDRPHRLVFTWTWEDSDRVSPETIVTLTLVGDDRQTQLRLVHEPFANRAGRLRHEQGWIDSVSTLAHILELEHLG